MTWDPNKSFYEQNCEIQAKWFEGHQSGPSDSNIAKHVNDKAWENNNQPANSAFLSTNSISNYPGELGVGSLFPAIIIAVLFFGAVFIFR